MIDLLIIVRHAITIIMLIHRNLVVVNVAGNVKILNVAGEIKHSIVIFILNKIINIVNSKEFEDLLCSFINILLAQRLGLERLLHPNTIDCKQHRHFKSLGAKAVAKFCAENLNSFM